VNNSLTCLHAGKLACQKKRARQLANWQESQLAPTLKPPNVKSSASAEQEDRKNQLHYKYIPSPKMTSFNFSITRIG
jgi:hypothetical protein